MGPLAALGFYLLNLLVVAAAGRLLLRLLPEASPGLILEIPPYRLPEVRATLRKVWFRLREFIVVAWPILIVGSVVLSLLEHFELAGAVNAVLAPLTSTLLGLPPEVGVSLVFGILRKELTIVMLVQALGTTDFASVLTTAQMCVLHGIRPVLRALSRHPGDAARRRGHACHADRRRPHDRRGARPGPGLPTGSRAAQLTPGSVTLQ